MAIGGVLFCALLGNGGAQPAGDAEQAGRNLPARTTIAGANHRAAVAVFERDHDRFVAEVIRLTEIPAPPFGEKVRGEAYLELLADAGLEQCEMDAEGNVMGLWRGRDRNAPLLAVAAHLDTVFSAETDVKVRRAGTRLRAAGVGEVAFGLASLDALARAMREARVEKSSDV